MTKMRNWNELYTRYLHGQCSPDEIRLLLEHFRIEGSHSELQSRIRTELANTDIPKADTPEVAAVFDRIQHRLMDRVSGEAISATPRAGWLRWLPYAAAVLVAMLVGMWFLSGDQLVNRDPVVVSAEDIGPGGNRAMLTLADGHMIELSEAQSGIIIGGGITYLDGSAVTGGQESKGTNEQGHGGLNVDQSGSQTHSVSRSLMLTTPKGGTYQITLSDGTNVWLNSASTLKYPSRFTGNERIVELEGEAYFEVSEQVNKLTSKQGHGGIRADKIPFKVVSNGQVVEVLGTQFNVSAYADEPVIKTTLVEGSVKVRPGTEQLEGLLLKPGEQAILTGTGMQKQRVDVEQFIAWKDGLFSFRETELHAVMSQISRWYDIAITYHDGVPTTHYYGAISRSESLARVLELLQQSGLNFKIEKVEGVNKLTVLP